MGWGSSGWTKLEPPQRGRLLVPDFKSLSDPMAMHEIDAAMRKISQTALQGLSNPVLLTTHQDAAQRLRQLAPDAVGTVDPQEAYVTVSFGYAAATSEAGWKLRKRGRIHPMIQNCLVQWRRRSPDDQAEGMNYLLLVGYFMGCTGDSPAKALASFDD